MFALPSKSEMTRWALLVAAGAWLLHPFATSQQLGTGDALWYTNMLADFVAQWRAGVFPVFVGQTEAAFNGAVYPLRVAPLYQHLGGVIDLLTGGRLGPFALQHACVLVAGFAGLFAAYGTLRCLAGERRWAACFLAILYLACPGVLGTIYTQDLYMTWMTVPLLPFAVFATIRTFEDDGIANQAWLGASLAALWYAHSPVALWMTMIAAVIQLVRLGLARQPAAWRRAGIAAAVFVALAHYPFVSVAQLHVPGAASAVTGTLAGQERITQVIHEVFPAILQPVSEHARQLSDLQLGYAWWAVLGLALVLSVRPGAPRAVRLLTAAACSLLLLLIPVPGLTDCLWEHITDQIKRITFYWPMHRFYLLLASLLAGAGLLALERLGPRAQRIAGVALALACAWSLWEARQFVGAGRERTATAEGTARNERPENRLLMAHSYGLFVALPPYFSHGVVDPGTESRLLDAATFEPLPVPLAPAAAWQPLEGITDANPGILRLLPTFTLQPGKRYALDFRFGSHDYRGVLQLSGRTFFREYVLPESGGPRAFGTAPGNSSTLFLWTTAAEPEVVTLRFIPQAPGATPAQFAHFGAAALRSLDPTTEPVEVRGWLPYRATVRAAHAGWLETSRMMIPGYAAEINGHPAEVRRSPAGLAMLAVPAGISEVRLAYPGTGLLRISYFTALAGWMACAAAGILHAARRRQASRG